MLVLILLMLALIAMLFYHDPISMSVYTFAILWFMGVAQIFVVHMPRYFWQECGRRRTEKLRRASSSSNIEIDFNCCRLKFNGGQRGGSRCAGGSPRR